jgi:cytochrome c-type biogenesis protein CcmH/NrfG
MTEYDRALDELDGLLQDGKIDQARYRAHRRRLLAEARRNRLPLAARVRRFMVILRVLAVVLLVLFAVWVVYSTVGAWTSG